MKKSDILVVFALILTLSPKAKAQTSIYVTLFNTNAPVQPNQMVSLVGYDWTSLPDVGGTSTNASSGNGWTAIHLSPFNKSINAVLNLSQLPQMVTGLTNIGVGGSWATFKITTPASANVITNYVPADAIVIPTSAIGNVQIILESSADLANWTAASPGTYSAASATNRFFRVRAVLN